MGNPEVPGLAWTIRPSLDRLEWQHGVYNEEFIQRLKLVMGHPNYFTDPSYGVVSPTIPATHTSGSASPLVVSTSTGAQALTVDINPGLAVTKSGMWILLENFVRQIPLADTTVGVPNVIYLEYVLQPGDLDLNDYIESIIPILARTGTSPNLERVTGLDSPESNQVRVDTVETYAGYVESVQQNFVPLAIATVQTSLDGVGATVVSLAIDHTQDTYTWNRPWWSAMDIEHRSMVGTGVAGSGNPHRTGENEISAGGWTRSQVELNHGMVLAEDQSVAKCPGYRCEAAIQTDQLLTDDVEGTNTGFPNKKYYALAAYPVRLGKCWITDPEEEVGVLGVPETNKIVFPGEDPTPGKTLNLYYTKVEALEPPVGANNVNFETNNPTASELVIAGGFSRTALNNTQELFSDARQFPMIYELFVDAEAAFRKTPQVVYCYKRLDVLGTQDTPTISQYGPGKLCVGLTGASGTPGMVVKIRVYGTDPDGVNINKLFTFTDSTWSDVTIPYIPTTPFPSSAFVIDASVFASFTSVVVEERTNDGPNSAIMIWCLQTPYDTYDKMKDACHSASVIWDGIRLAEIYDKRIIETTNRDWLSEDSGSQTFSFVLDILAGYNATRYIEDFRRPVLHSLLQPGDFYTTIDPVLAHLPTNNFSKLQVHREGPYRTRALPVLTGSGAIWHISLLPQPRQTGTNHWSLKAPRMRFKTPTGGWSSWETMSPVSGITNTYNLDLTVFTAEIPTAVQFELEPLPYAGMAIYG